MSDYRDLCRACGGRGTEGPARCACDDPQPLPGRHADNETLVACAEATGLECVAPATLGGEVVVARELGGSIVIRQAGGKHGVVDPAELLPPDYETEISKRFTLELSPDDASTLRGELESAGWTVGDGRERRRDDLVGEMRILDAATAATGEVCISTATYAVDDESREVFAETIVARDTDGSLRLLDEDGYADLGPEEGLIVLLPRDDENISAGLTEAGYALPQPRMLLTLPDGRELSCLPPHMRGGCGMGEYAGMSASNAILAAMREFGPLACFEMSAITGIRHRSLSGRIADLQHAGEIRESSATRQSPVTGGSQNVYEIGCDPDKKGVRRVSGAPTEARAGGPRQDMVVAYLRELGETGATTSEITEGLGGDDNGIVEHAISATTSDLLKLDIVRVVGKRPSTITGRPQSVFAV